MRKLMNDFHRRLEGEIPRLRRYARALTRNAVRADDLVQDTLARALRKEHLWQPGTDLRAWLFTIMHGRRRKLCLGSHRRHRSDRVPSVIRVRTRAGGAL